MTPFAYQLRKTEGYARSGMLALPHGEVPTPAFMPVGTQGTVRGLSAADLESVGAQIVLSNTYHLHLRPGEDVVAELGGLHEFMAWRRPLLTDSGGFQVFSLKSLRNVTDDGVEFQSHLDGRRLFLSPERAIDIQWALGADVAMAFDHVAPGTADKSDATDALERTTRWLERCATHHRALADSAPDRQTLWPIVQGATYIDLRAQALEQVLGVGTWTGIAIGGLAVGETKDEMDDVLDALAPSLPPTIPRYLMGVGFPDDLLRGIARGMDLFDCVAPTRNGRHGTAFTSAGPMIIRNASHRRDGRPLEESCGCETCQTYSRAYLRHLFVADEVLGLRLLSLHNVRFLIDLAAEARANIEAGTFGSWSRDWIRQYNHRGET